MRIAKLQPGRIDALAQVAAVAYADDPIYLHTYPDERRRREYHLRSTPASLRSDSPGRVVRVAEVDGVPVGFAIWRVDGVSAAHHERDPRLLRAIGWALRRLGPDRGRPAQFFFGLDASLPDERCWFLGVLAVHPDCQRRGIGRALLRDGLAEADAQGQAVRLQTSTPQNVAFYERSGFAVTQVHDPLYPGSPPLWSMRRGPRPATTGRQEARAVAADLGR
ncbi:GNAT family N-acetyltransferase [Antribacter sp. KLBMP9083]|uniref:GNAT family N-acetyltransferase n=1 Tax=Antribacter soli TaxID=2910976 RepID=A0AA41UB47_9MICO|nr:GNAT family N-acetyltransferase [Antribacter soli]MCF4123392.1 GNAT family N-acetyltransferase [Antribacter soli]